MVEFVLFYLNMSLKSDQLELGGSVEIVLFCCCCFWGVGGCVCVWGGEVTSFVNIFTMDKARQDYFWLLNFYF